jgi:hypothetical protein
MTDVDNTLRYWRGGDDPRHGVHAGRKHLEEILTKDPPTDKMIQLLLVAAEPMFDGPGHAPLEVERVAKLVGREIEARAGWERFSRERLYRYRTIITVLRARALHCAGKSNEAFDLTRSVHAMVESAAGGREALLKQLSSPVPNVYAEWISRVLGIKAASLRRSTGLSVATRGYWRREIRTLAAALLPGLDAERAVTYPGSESLVQVLFMLTEMGLAEDAELIAALAAFDERTRLKDHRGQSTIALREVALAKYRGDIGRAVEQSDLALSNLIGGHFERHLDVIDEQDILQHEDEDENEDSDDAD